METFWRVYIDDVCGWFPKSYLALRNTYSWGTDEVKLTTMLEF